jgi:hypothetical protein
VEEEPARCLKALAMVEAGAGGAGRVCGVDAGGLSAALLVSSAQGGHLPTTDDIAERIYHLD